MSRVHINSTHDVDDLIRGFAFFATGGGGLPANGRESLLSELTTQSEIVLADAEELADDALTACPFLMGSIAPHTDEVRKEMAGFGFVTPVNNEKARMRRAIEELERYTGRSIDAIVPIELAAANTSAAIAAASALGKMVLNGDYTGRAIPEIQQTTPYLHDKVITPISSVDEWDNVAIIRQASNYRVAERIGKLISAGAYGLAGQAGFLLSGKECKEVLLRETLRESLELGRLIARARAEQADPVAASLEHLGGWLIMRGEVTVKDDEDRIGYYWGTHTIRGHQQWDGVEAKVWFKNENHLCWLNDKPAASSPDLIVVVDAQTGEPIVNPLLKVGQEVAVLVFPARPEFRTPKGIDILGPRYFGFDVDYLPIEERVRSNGQPAKERVLMWE